MKKKILIIAAHPDDEVLGCGGLIAKHKFLKNDVRVLFMSEGVSARYSKFKENKKLDSEIKLRESMAINASKKMGFGILDFLRYPNLRMNCFPILDISKKILTYLKKFKPDEVYTHHPSDLNTDHTVTFHAAYTACRPANININKFVLFEIPSSTDWSDKIKSEFKPNYFLNIKKYFKQKLLGLKCYKKEMRKKPHSRSIENIKSLSKYRGGSVGLEYVEAYQIIRSIEN